MVSSISINTRRHVKSCYSLLWHSSGSCDLKWLFIWLLLGFAEFLDDMFVSASFRVPHTSLCHSQWPKCRASKGPECSWVLKGDLAVDLQHFCLCLILWYTVTTRTQGVLFQAVPPSAPCLGQARRCWFQSEGLAEVLRLGDCFWFAPLSKDPDHSGFILQCHLVSFFQMLVI